MRLAMIVLLWLGFSSIGLIAQNGELPTPDEIFEEGILWEVIDELSPSDLVESSRETQTLRVFDVATGEWQSFDYPPDVSSIFNASLQPDGRVYIYLTHHAFVANEFVPPQSVWILDTETGTYEYAPTTCEGRVLQTLPNREAVWLLAPQTGDDNPSILCHNGTGEMREIMLPELSEARVFTSPEQHYAIITGRTRQAGGDFAVFSYNISTDTVITLGEMGRGIDGSVWACHWFSETQAIMCGHGGRDWMPVRYYMANLEEVNSLQYITGGWRADSFFDEAEERFVFLFSPSYTSQITGSEISDPCTLTILDINGVFEQELAPDCVPLVTSRAENNTYLRQGDMLYYLAVDAVDTTVSSLQRFDLTRRGNSYPFITGEFEAILGISPDQQYAVLHMDNDGELDSWWREPQFCCREEAASVIIVHIETGQIRYISEPIGVYSPRQVVWLDNDTIIIASIPERFPIHLHVDNTRNTFTPSTIRRITFDGTDDVITSRFPFSMDELIRMDAPVNDYWIWQNHSLVDLRTFEQFRIIRERISEAYNVRMRWQENGRLLVSITHPDNWRLSAQYELTVQ